MRRFPLLLVGILVWGAWVGTVHGQDDDPPFAGRKLSEWQVFLRGEKEPLAGGIVLITGSAGTEVVYRWRRAGLIATERIGPTKSRRVFSAILEVMLDGNADARIRTGAAQSLEKLTPQAKKEGLPVGEVRDGLMTALRTDPSASVRQAAATALGVFELSDEPQAEPRTVHDLTSVLPVLRTALTDSERQVSRAAAETIRRMGQDAREAVPDLEKVLKDPRADPLTRLPVVQSLGKIGAPEAVVALPTLLEVLRDPEAPADVRRAVVECLVKLGTDASEKAVPLLSQLLSDPKTPVEVRLSSAAGLNRFGVDAIKEARETTLPALKKALKDEDKTIRCLAMHTLGQLGKDLGADTKEVVATLLLALDDSTVETRVTSLETLTKLAPEMDADTLDKVKKRVMELTRDSLKEVRDAAEIAQEKLKKL
jgi:HEAT repeat protein